MRSQRKTRKATVFLWLLIPTGPVDRLNDMDATDAADRTKTRFDRKKAARYRTKAWRDRMNAPYYRMKATH